MSEGECKLKSKGKAACALGSGGRNEIFMCPDFGLSNCIPRLTMIHEAAHNAGANLDVDEGPGYPPKDSECNPYSYEYFCRDIGQGLQTGGHSSEKESPKEPKKETEIKDTGTPEKTQ